MPSAEVTSCSTAFSRSSNSPRYFAPAISAPRSSDSSFLSFRLSGTSPLRMRSASPSTIAVLPTPGSPIRTGLFLVRRDKHLDGAPDFLVAADHRIELAVARRLREVARIFLQRVIGVLGRGAVGRAALAQGLDRRIEVLRRQAAFAQEIARLTVLVERQPQQQPLDGDKAVAGFFRGLLGRIEGARQIRRQIDLSGAAARHLRQFFQGSSVAFRIARELPPARSIRPPASPSLSSSSTFSICSDENC